MVSIGGLTAVDLQPFATDHPGRGRSAAGDAADQWSGYLASPLEFAVASPVDGFTWLADVVTRARFAGSGADSGLCARLPISAYALTRFETIVLPGSTLPTKELPYDRWI